MSDVHDDRSIRLYRLQPRGERQAAPVSDWIAQSDEYSAMLEAAGRWFTGDMDEALWYLEEHPEGELVFVDLPSDIAEAFRVSNFTRNSGVGSDNPKAFSARPDKEFFVSRAIAQTAQPFADLHADEAIQIGMSL